MVVSDNEYTITVDNIKNLHSQIKAIPPTIDPNVVLTVDNVSWENGRAPVILGGIDLKKFENQMSEGKVTFTGTFKEVSLKERIEEEKKGMQMKNLGMKMIKIAVSGLVKTISSKDVKKLRHAIVESENKYDDALLPILTVFENGLKLLGR
jgi:hypothetical protein